MTMILKRCWKGGSLKTATMITIRKKLNRDIGTWDYLDLLFVPCDTHSDIRKNTGIYSEFITCYQGIQRLVNDVYHETFVKSLPMNQHTGI